MTEDEFEYKWDNYEFDDEYSEYIMNNCHGERIICNGDTLIQAMEDGYLYEAFKETKVTKPKEIMQTTVPSSTGGTITYTKTGLIHKAGNAYSGKIAATETKAK